MPRVVFRRGDAVAEEEVPDDTNLVVRAGVRKFPFPLLRYRCGMGQCATCACRVVAGAEHLPPPNRKEEKQLGDYLARGYRLCCQLWLRHDITLEQPQEPLPGAGGKR